jgi:hypothetical protein
VSPPIRRLIEVLPEAYRLRTGGRTCSHPQQYMRRGPGCGLACLLRIKVRSHGSAMARPVYLLQRTYLVTAGTAVECQKRL